MKQVIKNLYSNIKYSFSDGKYLYSNFNKWILNSGWLFYNIRNLIFVIIIDFLILIGRGP